MPIRSGAEWQPVSSQAHNSRWVRSKPRGHTQSPRQSFGFDPACLPRKFSFLQTPILPSQITQRKRMWSLLRTTQCSLHKEVSWRLPPNTTHTASTRRHTHPISWLALRGSLSSSHMNKWECQTGDTGTQVWKTQQAWDTARVGRGRQMPSGRRWGSSAPASEFSHRREDRKLTDLSRL